ncbi:MAG: hypothetical protein PWQ57_1091 [Desulfovibrionales bacterium]|nr:hypothetical protein [Desulfovibrionales bacterium]
MHLRFKDITIKRKLLFNFAVMIAGIMIISGVTAFGMIQFRSVLEKLIYTTNRQNIAYKEIQFYISRSEGSFHDLLSARNELDLAEADIEFRQSWNAMKGILADIEDRGGSAPEDISKAPGVLQKLFARVKRLKSEALCLDVRRTHALNDASAQLDSARRLLLTVLDDNELDIYLAAEKIKAHKSGALNQSVDNLLSRYHFPVKSILDVLNGLNGLEVLARSAIPKRDEALVLSDRERIVSIADEISRNLGGLRKVLDGRELKSIETLQRQLASLETKLVGRDGVITLQLQVLHAWKAYEGAMDSASQRIMQIVSMAAEIASDMELSAERVAASTMQDAKGQLTAVGAVFALLLLSGGGFSYLINRSIARPLERGVAFAEAVSRGDLNASLEMDQHDEVGDLSRALDHMVSTLRRQDWIRAGKAGLDDRLRGQQDLRELSLGVVTFLVNYFEAQLGAMYLSDPSGRLRFAVGHAFSYRGGGFQEFEPGEGLVGQAGRERRIIFFHDVSEQLAPKYNFGAGEATPAHFMAAPLVYREGLEGVLLIGSMQPFPESARSFMEENLESVAIALQVAGSRLQVEDLLDQTRRQAEALREQQRELRLKNEELEEQAKALRESESTLQQQQEELRVTNEELAGQTKALMASESQLQQQQEELRTANEELEERAQVLEEQHNAIQNKNVALKKAQEEIQEQADAVERASRYKSEFLANMSHELRTPLNSILILSRILSENQEGNLTDKQVEFVQTVHGSGKDLLTLINEILDLAKVESGRMEVRISRVDVAELLEALRRMFEPQAERKGLALTVRQSPDCPKFLYSDSQRLTQILRNLLANAFKFTEQGEISLVAGRPGPDQRFATETLSSDVAVVFAVADTGVGVPEEKREVIFEAFRQADGAISRKFGGTGLGLSISREFARLLGGEIQMESEVGKGSVFTLCLPERLMDGEEDAGDASETGFVADVGAVADTDRAGSGLEPPSKDGAERDADPVSERSSNLLLIVEDDPVFAELLEDLARRRGFETLLAHDGETGLHLADLHRPDGMLLDVKLPGVDGFSVMERLKENPRTRRIPVHFISSADESPWRALRMGAVGYLAKPVEPEDIEAAFGRIEDAIHKPVKTLLVVEDDEAQRRSILELVASDGVAATAVASGREALESLSREAFDCVIMDLGLNDMSGFDLLEAMAAREDVQKAPVIVYTGRDLTREEEARLARNASSIIVKGARSPERLLDEATLFLHQMQEKAPGLRRKTPRTFHDPEEIFQGKTVLIVDDDLRNVFALGSVLEAKGMKVREAENGKEALRKLAQYEDVDIVLMDIMMPEMDGFETMRRIRAAEAYKDLPIIALTAKAMKGDKAKCIEAGANDYLSKPVENGKLLSLLRVWLHR